MAWPADATGSVTVTTAKGSPFGFIPALWSDEIVAAFKRNLVLANLISNISHTGKKGDTLRIPVPDARGRAYAKLSGASGLVTLNAGSNTTNIDVSIDKHYQYSKLIEDIADIQALPSLRQYYTDDAGYALARQVEQDIWLLVPTLNGGSVDVTTTFISSLLGVLGGDGVTAFDGNANSNTGNGTALTDAGIRKMVQTLDDNDVPLTERSIIVPPVEKKNLLGISRYTEQAFVGDGSSIRSGLIGNIYGIPVYVTSNCPFVHVDSTAGEEFVSFESTGEGVQPPSASADAYGNTVVTGGTNTKYRIGTIIHKSAIALVTQLDVRTQTQYKQEFLADLMTADTIYGVKELRDYAGVSFVVPA